MSNAGGRLELADGAELAELRERVPKLEESVRRLRMGLTTASAELEKMIVKHNADQAEIGTLVRERNHWRNEARRHEGGACPHCGGLHGQHDPGCIGQGGRSA